MIFKSQQEQVDFHNLLITLLEKNKNKGKNNLCRIEGILYERDDCVENILKDRVLVKICLLDYQDEERKLMKAKVKKLRYINNIKCY